jgi:hypothetical protein
MTQIQFKINELELMGPTCLIKWFGLKLTYRVLYSRFDPNPDVQYLELIIFNTTHKLNIDGHINL